MESKKYGGKITLVLEQVLEVHNLEGNNSEELSACFLTRFLTDPDQFRVLENHPRAMLATLSNEHAPANLDLDDTTIN